MKIRNNMKLIILILIACLSLITISADADNYTYGFSVFYNIPQTQNDNTAPVTNISLSGIFGNNSWYKSNVTVTLGATDNQSGVNYTTYNINNGSQLIYSLPFIISTQGYNIVKYYSADNAGNIEKTNSQPINIDKSTPGSITNLGATNIGRTYINWSWRDPSGSDISGFAYVMVYINGANVKNVSKGVQYYNATGLSRNTNYRIGTHTVDKAGNMNQNWVNNTAKTLK
jgi:hypothetical protein